MAKVRVNTAGVQELLRSPGMQRAVRQAAEAVAQNVRSQGIKVEDENGGADEVDLPVIAGMAPDGLTGVVTIAHAAGMAVQAKHGALTKAAAQAGLDVRGSA